MATSSIKIYQTVLTPARNALVDDLEAYLRSLTPTYQNSNFQYIKFGLDINIKIPMPQGAIANHSLGNYIRIAENGKVWYYFIMNTDWKAVNTVELKLSIDSINTFRNDLTFTDKTLVGREHGTRIWKVNSGKYFIRNIDRVSEQIPANKIVSSEGISITQKDLNFNWYLIYKTRHDLSPENPNNPIYCYCVADRPLLVSRDPLIKTSITPEFLSYNHYYYFTDIDNPSGTVIINNELRKFTDEGKEMLIFKKVDDHTIQYIWYEGGIGEVPQYSVIGNQYINQAFGTKALGPITKQGSGRPSAQIGYNTNEIIISVGNFFRDSEKDLLPYGVAGVIQKAPDKLNFSIGSVERRTVAFNTIDKTDSRIVKIIKLPYAPCNVSYTPPAQAGEEGTYTFPSEWIYDAGYMRVKDLSLSTEFLNENIDKVQVPELFIKEPTRFSAMQPRDFVYESKLFNSDFYNFKLVYDSFVKDIRLENYNTGIFDDYDWKPNDASFKVSFKPTNTINSKFAFKIEPELDNSEGLMLADYTTTSDYEKYLLVSRNNEETIFSNDYLNYIRTGYNYDKKAKEEANQKNALLGAVQIVGAVASFAASAITGGASIAAGIALTTGAIATFSSIDYTKQSNERSMQAKLASLAAQSTNVAGSDDVDLLSFYNKNRLQIIKYTTEPAQREALYKMFFYCGYKRDQMKIPNTDSRFWFNFIQCKPVFTEEGITPYNDYIADVKARYEAGVTVYHHHPGVGTEWDWQQQYENWETAITNSYKFSTDMLKDLSVDDQITPTAGGFKVIYTGRETLNGTNTFIEFHYYSYDTLIHDYADTRGVEIMPNTLVLQKGGDVQYAHYPYIVEARIVDTLEPWRNSDWLRVKVEGPTGK